MSSNYEEICNKNIKEYGEGSRHLSYFADIYSTRTHFIYEVLQNAEDALSRRPAGSASGYVHFHLHLDCLEIRHNGAPFNERDVTGICGIGEGTKAGDFTQIGKFGIGFKSVYAYTFFPKIHSGGEHFEIRRFVEPHAITRVDDKDTLIVLPFDQPDKRPEWAFRKYVSAADAVREIGNAIRKLGIRTLLFLRHIEEIKWTLPDGTSGQFIRNSEQFTNRDGLRKVEVLDQDDLFEEWRIFARDVEVQDVGESHQVMVEIAFLLKGGTITRANNTELVVFFPTEKKTELGFLIQAPFKATKARDNIKTDDPANRQLIEAAAQLAADSLLALRDLGLLNVASYAALPLRTQDFPESSLFRPVYDKVCEALKILPLLPAEGGGFIKADQAKLARGKDLVALFLPEQLDALFGQDGLKWLDDSITGKEATTDLNNFLSGVVEEIRPSKLKDKLTASFFAAQSEEWLCDFYSYLGKEQNYNSFSSAPFVRREDGEHVSPGVSDKPNAWLPPANAADIDQAIFPLVKRSFASNPEIGKFLRETVKLREPDKVDVVIQCLLQKYTDGSWQLNQDGYVRDIKEISVAYSNAKPDDATRLVSKLKETQFVSAAPAGNPQGGALTWVKPGEQTLYRQSKDLEQWFAGNETDKAHFSPSVISENFPDDLKSKLGFALGALIKRSTSGWNNQLRSYRKPEGGFDAYADFFGLEWAVIHPTPERAIFLWNKLLENVALIKGKELRSSNQKFPASSTTEFNGYSTLGKHCTEHAWLPKQDFFRRPEELLLAELSDDFEKTTPRAESVARALGMKQPVDMSSIAAAFGITPEEAERRMSVTTEEMKELEQRRQEKLSPPPLPDRKSPDPKRRGKKIEEEASDLPPKTTDTRPRSVDPDYSEAQSDARTYLKHQYTNDDGVMFCQLCQSPQPVMLNGDPYFEAVTCEGSINAHHEQNNLALCPNHAAMYKNGGLTPDTVQRAVLECKSQKVPLDLAGNAVELYFTQQHLGDLRAVLTARRGAGSNGVLGCELIKEVNNETPICVI